MNAFDKVIGYDAIKNELLQVTDMIKNPSCYEQLGARMPRASCWTEPPAWVKRRCASA